MVSILVPFWVIQDLTSFIPAGTDILYLLILALLCTTLAYVLPMRALRYLSAFTVNLTTNLEPVYGILLAVFIFRENSAMSITFYVGASIIIATVFTYPFIRKYLSKKSSSNA